MKKNLILLQLLPIATVIASCGGGGSGSPGGSSETPTYSCIKSEITQDAKSTYLRVYNSCTNNANIGNVLVSFPAADTADSAATIASQIKGSHESDGITATVHTALLKPYMAMTQFSSGALPGGQALYFLLPTQALNVESANKGIRTMPNVTFESDVPSYLDGKFNNTLMGITYGTNDKGNPIYGAYSMKVTNNSGFTLEKFTTKKYNIYSLNNVSLTQFTAYPYDQTEVQDCTKITSLAPGGSCYLGVQYTPAAADELGEVTFKITGTAFESYISLPFSSK